MNILYLIEPEIAGGLGENTIYDNYDAVFARRERPKISHLHYEFDGWLSDEILESTPCFIVTESLANDFVNCKLKGFKLSDVEISKSQQFKDLYPNLTLPKFKRIIPCGKVIVENNTCKGWNGDDFSQTQDDSLVITKGALDCIKKHVNNNCQITTIECL